MSNYEADGVAWACLFCHKGYDSSFARVGYLINTPVTSAQALFDCMSSRSMRISTSEAISKSRIIPAKLNPLDTRRELSIGLLDRRTPSIKTCRKLLLGDQAAPRGRLSGYIVINFSRYRHDFLFRRRREYAGPLYTFTYT